MKCGPFVGVKCALLLSVGNEGVVLADIQAAATKYCHAIIIFKILHVYIYTYIYKHMHKHM